jgi:5-methyltetrahydropteroyltriglutamate--homocysteine methyltransferase
MRLLTKNTGSYPRVGEGPEKLRLRRAYAQLEQGTITEAEFSAVQDDYTREVIAEQVEAGLDVVTDGQIRWYDAVSHFAKLLDGTSVNGLVRFFDTNYLVRQLVVDGPIKHRGPLIADEYAFAKKNAAKPVMPVITGPFTLAKHTVAGRREVPFDRCYAEMVAALAREIIAIRKAGADRLQVDEPSILAHPDEFDLFFEGVRALAAHTRGLALELYTYFGDATPLYEKLQALPVDVLGLDFTYGPGLIEKIAAAGSDKGLGFGLIDARNTKLEDERAVVGVLEKLLPKVKGARVYLNPSCGLEYLPRDRAQRKLRHLVRIARHLG